MYVSIPICVYVHITYKWMALERFHETEIAWRCLEGKRLLVMVEEFPIPMPGIYLVGGEEIEVMVTLIKRCR